jgi:cystathionine beta-lyase/cystathionine gamma-synthase
MGENPEDICPRPAWLPPMPTQPLAPPLYTSAVYRCQDPGQASRLLSGEEPGYVYSRDGHPNADLLADKCRELHGASQAVICASGMAALSTAVLAVLHSGDHVVVSSHLYGRSRQLLSSEISRLGMKSTIVDTCDLAATRAAITPDTKLVVVETITNPLVRVSDLAALAALCHANGAELLVDNTFAGPTICRPLEFGADFVVESLTKIMNGHSDVLLGMLCGGPERWDRIALVLSAWGLSSSPFDCWQALRGMGTLALRANCAGSNALAVAEFLAQQRAVEAVYYPGLETHPDHALAKRQFQGNFGSIVTATLRGGLRSAEAFIAAVGERIPFCPSLGDLSTTLSHPESTSHRGLTPEARQAQGIAGGTLRFSVGIESRNSILATLEQGLSRL